VCVNEVLALVVQVLPSVLVALHDEEPRVRHAAVTWLRAGAALGREEGGGKVLSLLALLVPKVHILTQKGGWKVNAAYTSSY
jgi:hypothetical protein